MYIVAAMSERIVPYWLVTTAVYFAGLTSERWQPAVRVCLSYKMAVKYAERDRQHPSCRDPEISGPFYKKVPRSAA